MNLVILIAWIFLNISELSSRAKLGYVHSPQGKQPTTPVSRGRTLTELVRQLTSGLSYHRTVRKEWGPDALRGVKTTADQSVR